MEHSFWHARWARDEIGFHAADINPHLAAAFESLFPASNGPRHTLVPLCGKTLDLHWLAARSAQVTGIEFVDRAVIDFFAEAGVTPAIEAVDVGAIHSHGNLRILRGDFFATPTTLAADVDFFYDRAALIALPPELRARYVEKLAALVPTGAQGIIVTIDYDQSVRGGPPFAVSDDHLLDLCSLHFACTRIERSPVQDPPRGLEDRAFASTWHVRRL
jgi:thiopurine S-methyltransferase